jgi:hypothetical protein
MSARVVPRPRRYPRWVRALTVLAAALLALTIGLAAADRAQAIAPIDGFNAEPSTTQAGAHPDILVQMQLGNKATQNFPEKPDGSRCYCQNPKTIRVSLPEGVIGDPHATPQCTAFEFSKQECPPESQVGVQTLLLYGEVKDSGQWFVTPLYNMEPRPGQPGLLGFSQPLVPAPIYQEVSSRTGSDFGLDATVKGLTQLVPVFRIYQALWGVPSDPVHDALRFPIGRQGAAACAFTDPTPSIFGEVPVLPSFCGSMEGSPSSSAPRAFLSNPTACVGPLTAKVAVSSYDNGEDHKEDLWPATTGCDQLSFNPSLSAQPTTRQTDAASGLDVDLTVPQASSPYAPANSEIRSTTVTLPEGFSINPNAADGKTTCSDAEASIGTELAANCPEYAKIGTLTIESSALLGPLPGYVYLADSKPGQKYRMFLVADGYGVHIKLPGVASSDPLTGRLVISFQDLPQTPFSRFKMHLFGSERGLLATPTQCGAYAVQSTYTAWASVLPEQSATQFFSLDSGPGGSPCPPATRPFGPTVTAGVKDNTGGTHSPFTLALSRPDGDQNITGISVKTPVGFAATLRGVPYCPESALAAVAAPGATGLAELAKPACPAASQIGSATIGAGAGARPLYTPGKVYLAGPYKGAPLSLAVVVPAVSGPYDLGNVVVRAAINVDPVTTQITTVSDPMPQIVEGIPLRVRSVLINLDRPNFTLNPTDCSPFDVASTLRGNQGGLATPTYPFQAANCTDLDFGPKLALNLIGGTKRAANPALKATLTQPAGQANLSKTVVTLPHSEFLDQSHIKTICTRVQFAADNCPAGSIYGKATATSPLLDRPLTGPVYLRSSSNTLPDMVADLRGQIDVELVGRIDSKNEGIRVSFDSIPDAGVSKFILEMRGGAKGLLVNSTNICKGEHRAEVRITGQNGRTANQSPLLQASCRKSKASKREPGNKRAGNGKGVNR